MPTSAINPKVDWYFAKATKWQEEQEKLRKIVLDCGLREDLKWGHPCYTIQKNNIVLIHAFKDYCALLFMKGALLKDDHGVLVQQTENVQAARQIRFTGLKEVMKLERTIKAYIHEAMEVEQAGLKVEMKKTKEFDMPEEFQHALKQNPSLKKAFFGLTPGRQRGYLLHFSSAKQSKTREARIEKCMDRILDGKGLDDPYTVSAVKPQLVRSKSDRATSAKTASSRAGRKPVKLLSGGNPQIAKGDGNETIQAYIAAMPSWKRDVGLQLDALISRTVPKVRKAVKWNTPMYGVEGLGWFLGFHCVTKYVKVAFFCGASLRPLPPEASKQKEVRYFHIHEGDVIDRKLVANWIRQASKLPGWMA